MMIDNPAIVPFKSIILKYSKMYDVPSEIIASTIYTESRGDVRAFNGQNSENSRGLMQISQRTALSYPLSIPYILLDRLYEADYNIETGTKYLAYIRSYLKDHHLDKVKNMVDYWTVITSSYNQGHAYYGKALDTLEMKNKSFTWRNIAYYVKNPVLWSKTPWISSVDKYGPDITGRIDLVDLAVKGGISMGVVGAIGAVGFLIYKSKTA